MGKFHGKNVWQIYPFQAFDERKFGKSVDQPKGYRF